MSDYPHKGRPLPQWYDDSKFGIFIHWGPYAVPCYAPVDHDLGELVAESKWEEVFKSSPYVEWYLNSWSFDDSAVTRFHNDHFAGRTYESFAAERIRMRWNVCERLRPSAPITIRARTLSASPLASFVRKWTSAPS